MKECRKIWWNDVTTGRIRFECWISKIHARTRTHAQNCNMYCFPTATMLRYTYIVCLVLIIVVIKTEVGRTAFDYIPNACCKISEYNWFRYSLQVGIFGYKTCHTTDTRHYRSELIIPGVWLHNSWFYLIAGYLANNNKNYPLLCTATNEGITEKCHRISNVCQHIPISEHCYARS